MNPPPMPGTYITDMRHFVPKNPETPLPAPAARMRDFHGGIVRAATASPLEEFVSGIPADGVLGIGDA